MTTKPSCWRPERPGLQEPSIPALAPAPPPACSPPVDATLLQWWLDSACKLLVLDPHSNPLSFPLVEHLAISPALCFAVESFSAGHKGNWGADARVAFFEKRSLALGLCRSELTSKTVPLETIFFTVLLIGLPTPFMENIDDYGKEHLIGARAVLNLLLQQDKSAHIPNIEQLLAYYTWWDMACAFSVDSQELPPLSTSEILSTIARDAEPLASRFAGCMVEMYHVLGLLLRYCGQLLRGGVRDPEHEQTLERALTDWHPTQVREEDVLFAEAFQKHGLIIFYRVCRMRPVDSDNGSNTVLKTRLHEYATTIVSMVLPHQIGTTFWNGLTLPLLTAGAELTRDDQVLRDTVREGFLSVCSQCRTNTLVRAKDLLEEIWILRDSGIEISYLELMVQKGWSFSLV